MLDQREKMVQVKLQQISQQEIALLAKQQMVQSQTNEVGPRNFELFKLILQLDAQSKKMKQELTIREAELHKLIEEIQTNKEILIQVRHTL